jgi:hypothetical protein
LLFELIDLDRNGLLSLTEVKMGMKTLVRATKPSIPLSTRILPHRRLLPHSTTRHQQKRGVDIRVSAKSVILSADKDLDRKLDKDEFAAFMSATKEATNKSADEAGGEGKAKAKEEEEAKAQELRAMKMDAGLAEMNQEG